MAESGPITSLNEEVRNRILDNYAVVRLRGFALEKVRMLFIVAGIVILEAMIAHSPIGANIVLYGSISA